MKSSDTNLEIEFGKKFYTSIVIVCLVIAALVAYMPWMGIVGLANPKTAETGGLWINFLGKFHPLLLHLPIGALMLIFCMEGLKLITRGRYVPKTTIALAFAAGSAVLAVILGYFWYLSGGHSGELIEAHKRDGVIFTVLMILTFLIKFTADVKKIKPLQYIYLPMLAVSGFTMMSAGHHGGEMSHGDPLDHLPSTILAKREAEKNKPVVTDPMVYQNIVHSILTDKCISCHGEDKKKGDLRLDSIAAMLKGGSDEDCLIPGNVKKSFLLTSIDLPEDEDQHMPPKEKPQITPEEKLILTWWVQSGAPYDKKLSELKVPSEIIAAIDTLKTPEQRDAEQLAIREERQRLIRQMAQKRQQLSAAWTSINAKFPGSLNYRSQKDTSMTFSTVSYKKSFTETDLSILNQVAKDLAELDLSAINITDSGAQQLKEFVNLEKLKLNQTKITDKALIVISKLKSLKTLNLYGTAVSDAGIKHLNSHPSLERVYLWNTKVTTQGAQSLQESLTETAKSNQDKLKRKPKVLRGISTGK